MTEQEQIYYAIKKEQATHGISITQAADRVLGAAEQSASETPISTQYEKPAAA